MKLPQAISCIAGNLSAARTITKQLLELKTPAEDSHFKSTLKSLEKDLEGYRGTVVTDTVEQKLGKEHIETLESSHDSTHNHHEIAVVLDFRKRTTLDRDSNQGRQVFWIDMDAIEYLADVFSISLQEKDRLYESMVLFQIGVYLALCDGTHPFIVVK